MKNLSKYLFIFLSVTALFFVSGCGGGGGGTADTTTDGTTTDTTGGNTTTEQSDMLKLSLKGGDFWEYTWTYHTSSYSQDGSTSSSNKYGKFKLTLGTPYSSNGLEVFPLVRSGEFPESPVLRWTHLAIASDGSLLGSKDGSTFSTIYEATKSSWEGGGFFISFPDDATVNATAATFEGTYNTLDAIKIGFADSQGGCEYILGETICTGDSTSSVTLNEYLKEGVGVLGYQENSTYTFSGGNYYTSYTKKIYIELIDTSLSPTDGSTFNKPKWEELTPMPTPRTDFATAVLNGEIYVIGGYSSELAAQVDTVEVYNPATKEWRTEANMPAARMVRNKARVIGDKIYVYDYNSASNDADYIYDTATKTWSTTLYTDSSFSIMMTPWDSNVIALPFYTTTQTNIPVYIQDSARQWSLYNESITNYNKWSGFEMAVIDDTLYLVGGYYLSNSTWNEWSTYTKAMSYSLLNGTSYELTYTGETGEMKDPRRGSHIAINYQNKLFVLGGLDKSKIPLSSVEVYDPATNQWEEGEAMYTPVTSGGAAVIDGKLYVVGKDSLQVYNP